MNDADRREKKRKDKALERELERILQEQDRKKAQDDAKSKPSGNITTRRRRVSFRENPDIRQLPDDDEIPDVGPSGAPIPHPSGRENDDEDPRNLPDRRYSQTLAVEEAMFIGAGASVNSVNWSKTENHYHHSREQYTQGDPEAGQQPETALHAVVWRTLSGFWWLGRMSACYDSLPILARFTKKLGPVSFKTLGLTSRSRSRGRVDRTQRCRMLRRFHQVLLTRGADSESLLTKFTPDILAYIDRLLGDDDDWRALAAGEEKYDENWENLRSLSQQLVHLRSWYADANESSPAEKDAAVEIEAAAAAAAASVPLHLPEPETTNARSRSAKKDASQAYRRLRAAKTASVEAEEHVKANKDRLRDIQATLNLAKASLARAGGDNGGGDGDGDGHGDGSLEVVLAELDLNRRTVKERRNEAHKMWAESVERHRSAYSAWAQAAAAFDAAEVAEQVKAREWGADRRRSGP
ncbi:hypothetical protein LZ30DRAFT_786718 [Colletotrichum cereale]|nr:hypothetical protein LZ30DRAFT_786718 [Colletotrichum cereale]